MKQSDLFLQSEGDAWHERNKDKPRLPDPVIEAMKARNLHPKTVLELGCGNGWRLKEINEIWNPTRYFGYDASAEAIADSVVGMHIAKSDILWALQHIKDAFYDTIIFGFCLYLVDREDLMMIAAHTDRVLQDKGHVVIQDFVPDKAHKRPYHHKEGVWSYKDDYSRFWPYYRHRYGMLYGDKIDDSSNERGWRWNWDTTTVVSISQKDIAAGWPERME